MGSCLMLPGRVLLIIFVFLYCKVLIPFCFCSWFLLRELHIDIVLQFRTLIGFWNSVSSQRWWWWCYPTPYEGWERGGTPRRPNSRATPQVPDQRPEMEKVVPKMAAERIGRGTAKEGSQILQRASAGAARRTPNPHPA